MKEDHDGVEEVGIFTVGGMKYRVATRINDEAFKDMVVTLALRATRSQNKRATIGNGAIVVIAERIDPE